MVIIPTHPFLPGFHLCAAKLVQVYFPGGDRDPHPGAVPQWASGDPPRYHAVRRPQLHDLRDPQGPVRPARASL